MLVRSKDSYVPSLHKVHLIAIRHIFEPYNVKPISLLELEQGIEFYTNKFDKSDDEKQELKRIVNALVANENGYFDRAKMLQAMHGISWRGMYKDGLPYIQDDRLKRNKA